MLTTDTEYQQAIENRVLKLKIMQNKLDAISEEMKQQIEDEIRVLAVIRNIKDVLLDIDKISIGELDYHGQNNRRRIEETKQRNNSRDFTEQDDKDLKREA